MSLPALGYAIAQEAGSPTRKLVLIALAECHNGETGRCDPGIAHLRRLTELGERAIRTALAGLADDGIIGRERKRGSHGHLGTYRYTFPGLPARAAARQPASDAARQPAPGAAQNQEENLEPGRGEPGNTLAPAAREYDPLKGTKIDGRNLPFDALAGETHADVDIEGGKIAVALKVIRRACVRDWPVIESLDAKSAEAFIATEIAVRAQQYRERWPEIELTPTALASNWSRVTTARPGRDHLSVREAAQRGLDYGRETA